MRFMMKKSDVRTSKENGDFLIWLCIDERLFEMTIEHISHNIVIQAVKSTEFIDSVMET